MSVQAIVDANLYLTLATADASGRPWATPVWFAHVGYRDFLWVSDPQAGHSRNIAVRPEVGIVIFDSHQPTGSGEGVYMEAVAAELAGSELDAAIEAFSRRSEEQGAPAWTRADVEAPARHRLYRARVTQHYVNDERDRRTPVEVERARIRSDNA
jgi:nitroimidazol reductase NimA-like FMN-containing flavoprotein (pyridoxamine 5'-phosphate oxidase superfamily)